MCVHLKSNFQEEALIKILHIIYQIFRIPTTFAVTIHIL